MIPKLAFELTLEQQFQMQVIEKEVTTMSREKLTELLLQTSHLLMVKENLIKSLVNKVA